VNLQSKKFKTKYTLLIGKLLNSEYELRISPNDKLCSRCVVLCERLDELQHETVTVKNVLSRQIAHTYSIETDAEMVFMDKSKIFVELRPGIGGIADNSAAAKYSCKQCPRFVTDSIDTVNAHILYHKIANEEQRVQNDILKEHNVAPGKNKTRETIPQRSGNEVKQQPQQLKQVQYNERKTFIQTTKPVTKPASPQKVQQQQEAPLDINNIAQEYDEETMDSLIDLNLLDNPDYDSNMQQTCCNINNCQQSFSQISDYVRHLKLQHKSTANSVYAAVRSNIKRPSKVGKLTCPFCFIKTSSEDALEQHVKEHEEASKSPTMTNDRLNHFLNIISSSARCKTCDCEILDPTEVNCNHEIVKNGLVQKMNCMYCSSYFYSDKLYNNHLALKHGHCFICGSSCEDKAVLRDHIRSHMR